MVAPSSRATSRAQPALVPPTSQVQGTTTVSSPSSTATATISGPNDLVERKTSTRITSAHSVMAASSSEAVSREQPTLVVSPLQSDLLPTDLPFDSDGNNVWPTIPRVLGWVQPYDDGSSIVSGRFGQPPLPAQHLILGGDMEILSSPSSTATVTISGANISLGQPNETYHGI